MNLKPKNATCTIDPQNTSEFYSHPFAQSQNALLNLCFFVKYLIFPPPESVLSIEGSDQNIVSAIKMTAIIQLIVSKVLFNC